jgi:hypothetical protein
MAAKALLRHHGLLDAADFVEVASSTVDVVADPRAASRP